MKTHVSLTVLLVITLLSGQSAVLGNVTEDVKLAASDPAIYDAFGDSVDVFGDLAVVGVPRDDTIIGSDRGSAYIYRWNDSTSTWDEEAYLIGPAGHGTYFGDSVAAGEDTVVIGQATGNTAVAAYVYQWDGSNWLQEARLTPSSISTINDFASAVDISGETVIVGDWDNGTYQGAAYIYEMPGTGWADMTETIKLSASDGAAGDYFGVSVGISGDTAVIGAQAAPSWTFQGAAYIFERSAPGAWSETAKLTASDAPGDKDLGQSVAISGDTVVAGAPGDSSHRGAAYVYHKPGGGWTNATETQKLFASDRVPDDQLGFQVDISGDLIVATAPFDGGNIGSAYTFARSAGVWSELNKLVASDSTSQVFGFDDVSLSGNVAMVGVDYSNGREGAVYVYGEPASATLLGDFDGNNHCDALDFLFWQRDSTVGSLTDWETNYGEAFTCGQAIVPEPHALVLLLCGVALAGAQRRR